MKRYRDRGDAGRVLAGLLRDYAGRDDVVVLGLPRGGVPVAAEVARALGAPLDVFMVRKLGVPGHEELAMGAIASGGVRVLNPQVIDALHIPGKTIEMAVQREQRELARRELAFRGDRPAPALRGRTAILVDDGLATGATMRAAVAALRALEPARIVVAVPVGAEEACEHFREVADEVVCALMPRPLDAVGLWYEDFGQTSDAEVQALLGAAQGDAATRPHARR
jgi:putative phosphoribosyl transferase